MPKTTAAAKRSKGRKGAAKARGSTPRHWKAVIELLRAHMQVADVGEGALAAKLGVLPGNLYQYLRGDKVVPLSWVGISEARKGNHRTGRKVDLPKALKLTGKERDRFVELVMISHCPEKLADIIEGYRKAAEGR